MVPAPPPELSAPAVAFVVGFLVFVGVVKGTSGFGSGLLSVPVLIQLFPPELALASLTLVLWFANLPILAADGIPWLVLDEQRALVGAAVVGTVVGLLGFVLVPVSVVYLLVAGFIVAVVAADRRGDRLRALAARPGAGAVAGGLGGIVTGAFLTGGPVFVTYLHARAVEKTQFATTMALLILVMATIRIASLSTLGGFGAREAALGVGFLVPITAGVIAGTKLRHRIPQRAFRRLIRVVLIVIAAKLAADGIALVR